MRSRGAMRGNHVDLAKPAVMQQHATRHTSKHVPNSAAATSTAPKCAASQPAMNCGPASLRSHQSSAKRPACSSVSQPLAISERNRVFVIKHRVEGERHKGCLQRFGAKAQWHLPSARSSNHNGNLALPSSLLPPPSSLLALPSSLLPLPSSLLPTTLPTTTCQIPHSPSPSPKGMIKGPHGASCPPLPRRRNQEEQPRGAARSGSQEQQLGAAARSGSQEAWARQVVGQGQEAHAPHSQEAQPGGRGSSQQGGSKESAMAHGDNSEWPAPCCQQQPSAMARTGSQNWQPGVRMP
ncbi:hypothetical protein QJQ45_026559 [Haematococcus lacustris]|nr:hypothetical protein QJQ45_026559 [Haematococcus lacustris]